MERRRFGPTGLEVAVLGQGTWYPDQGDRAAAIATLRLGLDRGLAHIDTAEMYGQAAVVAEALAGRRDEVVLASKVLRAHASRRGTMGRAGGMSLGA